GVLPAWAGGAGGVFIPAGCPPHFSDGRQLTDPAVRAAGQPTRDTRCACAYGRRLPVHWTRGAARPGERVDPVPASCHTAAAIALAASARLFWSTSVRSSQARW